MTDHSSASIRPPKNWQDFERNCRILFECILNDIHVQNNGRVGQPQHGVDIFGRKNREGTWVGIQCKGKDSGYGGTVTEKELRAEVEKTRGFIPQISDFFLVTTAPVDASIQTIARMITQGREEEGNPLNVSVWGWGELESRISQYPKALEAFHPDASPYSSEIIGQLDLITQTQQPAIIEKLDLIIQTQQLAITGDNISVDSEIFDKNLHAEIDGYRDLIKAGKPTTSLILLESLKDRLWDSASDRIKFRIITNIGSANLHISKEKEKEGVEHFLEAIKYQPEDKIALANVALAYLLKGEHSKAVDAAKAALEKDNSNAEAASYLIQAYIKDETVDDPIELVPEVIRGSASVDIACIIFYRLRNSSQWVEIARAAGKQHPDNEQILRFAAEAELQTALTTQGLLNGQKPAVPIDREGLRQAATVLQTLWDKQHNSELPVSDSSLPHNLIQTYRVLEDKISAKTIAVQAIEKIPDSPDLIKLRAAIHLEDGQPQEALSLLKKNSADPQSILMSAEILSKNNPVSALSALENYELIEGLEQHQRILAGHVRVDCFLLHPGLSSEDRIRKAEKEADALLEQYPDSPQVFLIHSRVAEAIGKDSAIQQAVDRAKALLKNDTPFSERLMLARKFEVLQSYSDVVDVLDGYVDSSHDSPALQMLFFALINCDRRLQAHELFLTVPVEVAEKPAFLRASISLHYQRGDYTSAENSINKLLRVNPNDLYVHLTQTDIWLRRRNDNAIKQFLSTEVEKLEGDPEELMKLAYLLDRFGFHERALKLGYKTHLENRKNSEVQLAYIMLLLKPGSSGKLSLTKTTVEKDAAFSIKNNLDETETFVIESDISLQLIDEAVPPEHLFADTALGLKEGDKFSIKSGEEWEITSIKHKYLYALHEKLYHFERYFPESNGLQRMTFKEEDGEKSIESVLQKVKEIHDAHELILNRYSESSFPLHIFAEHFGIDIIDAWGGLVQSGRKFKVCYGIVPERIAAFKCIEENNKAGCVVDALTLHIIKSLRIEKEIAQVCGSIAVTESTIDTFRYRRERILSYGRQPFMTVYWRDGQYFREEITQEHLEKILVDINRDLDWIDQNIEVLPAESDGLVSNEVRRLNDALSYSFLDPIIAAQGSNRLLLCEDQYYRQLGIVEFNVKTSWLQPVLMLALQRRIITQEKYGEIIITLVEVGHSFISIDPDLLSYAFKNRKDSFEKISQTLFIKDSDIKSHLRVLLKFLHNICRWNYITLSEKKATSILLERLFFGEWREDFPDFDYRHIASLFLKYSNFMGYSLNTVMKEHFRGWLRGHFLFPFDYQG